MEDLQWDCVVVGSGHAGSCAALSATEHGLKRVLIIDKCPEEWVGGNGYFTAGAHRTTHQGLHDLLPIVCNVTPEQASDIDMEPYAAEEFTSDIMRLGDGQSNPGLVEAVVQDSRGAVQWLAERAKIPFTLSFNRQAYLVDGRQKFWGGLVLSVQDGGKGLIAAHRSALQQAGVHTWFDTPALELISKDGTISGLLVERAGKKCTLSTPAVILACGGFEADPALRAKHMGAQWARAKVSILLLHHKNAAF